jgi:aryl-alcohol dehydrogenase-like predicted oxidoreductase
VVGDLKLHDAGVLDVPFPDNCVPQAANGAEETGQATSNRIPADQRLVIAKDKMTVGGEESGETRRVSGINGREDLVHQGDGHDGLPGVAKRASDRTGLSGRFWNGLDVHCRTVGVVDAAPLCDSWVMSQERSIGPSGILVPPIGVGCWAIGGQFWADDQPLGWGEVDDRESLRALRRAFDLGIRLFDTADVYGTGHSERILAQALAGHRDEVIIATKWGNTYDEGRRALLDPDISGSYARRALEASLRRLGTDYVDIYQFHLADVGPADAAPLLDVLEDMVTAGQIRTYGWSTDDPERAASWSAAPHAAVVQHELNVLNDAPEMLALVERLNWASINRGPLAMGLISDKYTAHSRLADDDVRSHEPEWMRYFKDGRPAPEWLSRRDAVREILVSGGRSPVQGALAWNLARSPRTIPIPGCRTVAQVEENAAALEFGPLDPAQLTQIDAILGR